MTFVMGRYSLNERRIDGGQFAANMCPVMVLFELFVAFYCMINQSSMISHTFVIMIF